MSRGGKFDLLFVSFVVVHISISRQRGRPSTLRKRTLGCSGEGLYGRRQIASN